MLESIQNVLNVPEFRKRAVFTLIMFIIFRLGVHIPVPGVDAAAIEGLFNSGNLFGLLDLFSGGALSKFSVLAMSITPYINASIIMQLLTAVVPTPRTIRTDVIKFRKLLVTERFFSALFRPLP